MNRTSCFLTLLCFVSVTLSLAQAPPNAFNYSSVIRGNNGQALPKKAVAFRFSILSGSSSGSVVYQETQTTTTDQWGVVSLSIGLGTTTQGTFAAIDWASNTYYLKIELDDNGGVNFQLMGTVQFLSVPYALHAKTSESVVNYSETDPVFDGSVAKGITEADLTNWNSTSNCNCPAGDDIFIPSKAASLVTLQRLSTISDSTIVNFNKTDWYYIAWTKATDRTGIIYINGDPVFSGTFQNDAYNHTQVHIAARYFTSFASYFNGLIDEIRISNRARTAGEIKSYYTSNSAFTADANTVAIWHFDEGTGTSFSNEMGGSGQLVGNPTWVDGRFGKAIEYDGVDDRGQTNFDPPENNTTYEFWVKFPYELTEPKTLLQAYNLNNYDMMIHPFTQDKGVILQSNNGTCWQLTVDNTGQLKSMSVPCPN